jgi:hypothetical protein
MASKTIFDSKISKVNRGTSGGDSYYTTDVTTLADGGVKRETYRSDDKGNNKVLVQTVQVDKDGEITRDEVSSNASINERRDLRNPKSQLRNSITNQVNSVKKELAKENIDNVTESTIDKSSNGSGNAALNEVQTGDTSRPSGEPPKNRAGTRDDFGAELHYPVSRDPKQDKIKFDMLKYETKKVEGLGFGDRSESSGRTIGTVTLPIPGGLSDSNACNWGDDNMNPLQLAGTAAALQAMGTNMPGVSNAFGGIIDGIKKNNDAVNMAIDATVASQAVGTNINSVLGRFGGSIINPNLELLFQGPSLRPFTFQFKMSPRSKDEAEEILKIIRFFKQGMAPIREQSRLFLKTPHTFKIKYVQLGSQEESKFLNKFKECALLSCSVQYTPEGNYAPYEDGAMSSYQMSLQFKELEPVFNDDYGSDGDLPAEIGF